MTTDNAVSGAAIMSPGAMAAMWLIVAPLSLLPFSLLVATGAAFGAGGCIKLVRALRARSAIRAKLRMQELPSARLLASGPKRET